MTNRLWRVAQLPGANELIGRQHFAWCEEQVADPAPGEFLVRTICLAPVPAQRGYLSTSHKGFLENIAVGDVMRGRGVGEIVASCHPDYPPGEIFVGSLGWQSYSLQRPRGKDFVFSTGKLADPPKPLSMALGLLGQAGATAYFGLEVGSLKSGDAVLISAAAGGVGSIAGQIARIRGARRVAGIAGSEAKCRWLVDELGYDAAINYRSGQLAENIRQHFPDGIDLFFDNVGGEILNEALGQLARNARAVICGFIATDYAAGQQAGPINYRQVVYQRARIEGFVVFDYWERFPEAQATLGDWHRRGLLQNCEDLDEGLEKMPDALASLFTGANCGIKLCRVGADP